MNWRPAGAAMIFALTAACSSSSPPPCSDEEIRIDGECLVVVVYEMSAPADQVVGAGGEQAGMPMPIKITASLLDESPTESAGEVLVQPESAGTLETSYIEIGPEGTTADFTPCDVDDPDTGALCTGEFRIVFHPDENPGRAPAGGGTQLIDLVAPGFDSCLGDENQAWFVGTADNFFAGHDQYTNDWAAVVAEPVEFESFTEAGGSVVELQILPDDSLGWNLMLEAGDGDQITAGPYPGVNLPWSADPGQNGLAIDNGAADCTTVSGRFDVIEIEFSESGDELLLLDATFRQLCDGQPSRILTGCIKYTAE